MQNNQNYQLRLNQLTNKCCDSIEDLMQYLDVPYTKSMNRLFGTCPVHGGDNPLAWNFYPEGDTMRGFWQCYTQQCEKKWKPNLIGFVRGVKSHTNRKECSFKEAVDILLKFAGYKRLEDIPIPSQGDIIKRALNNATEIINTVKEQPRRKVSRASILPHLEIPSQLFIDRGFSASILSRYDVGLSREHNRVMVPVYDQDYKYVIGMLGRSVYPECPQCGYYHHVTSRCPLTVSDRYNSCKWKNGKDFEASNCLYNYWFAREHIQKSGVAIVVEGPADIWKLEEAGIHNGVALFKAAMSEAQQMLLETSWASTLILCLDNDEAGKRGAEDIQNRLKRSHNIIIPNAYHKDIGETPLDDLQNNIGKILHELELMREHSGLK